MAVVDRMCGIAVVVVAGGSPDSDCSVEVVVSMAQ